MLLGVSGKTRKTHIQRNTYKNTHTNTEVSRKAYGTRVFRLCIKYFRRELFTTVTVTVTVTETDICTLESLV